MTPAAGRYRVLFNDALWAEDLSRLSSSGKEHATTARTWFETYGLSMDDTLPCRPEGQDGTRLPGCRKRYIPAAGDPYRIILAPVKLKDGTIVFTCVAFGLGHPPAASNVPDAYKLAHYEIVYDATASRSRVIPSPGRESSGRSEPSCGRGAPSNSMPSIRTWSWNPPRRSALPSAAPPCAYMRRWRRRRARCPAHRLACDAHAPLVSARVTPDLHLHPSQPLVDPARELLGKAFVVVRGEAAGAVDGYGIVEGAEQRAQRQPRKSRSEIPQRDIDRRDRHRGDADAAVVAHRAPHRKPRRRNVERQPSDDDVTRRAVDNCGARRAAVRPSRDTRRRPPPRGRRSSHPTRASRPTQARRSGPRRRSPRRRRSSDRRRRRAGHRVIRGRAAVAGRGRHQETPRCERGAAGRLSRGLRSPPGPPRRRRGVRGGRRAA